MLIMIHDSSSPVRKVPVGPGPDNSLSGTPELWRAFTIQSQHAQLFLPQAVNVGLLEFLFSKVMIIDDVGNLNLVCPFHWVSTGMNPTPGFSSGMN